MEEIRSESLYFCLRSEVGGEEGGGRRDTEEEGRDRRKGKRYNVNTEKFGFGVLGYGRHS